MNRPSSTFSSTSSAAHRPSAPEDSPDLVAKGISIQDDTVVGVTDPSAAAKPPLQHAAEQIEGLPEASLTRAAKILRHIHTGAAALGTFFRWFCFQLMEQQRVWINGRAPTLGVDL